MKGQLCRLKNENEAGEDGGCVLVREGLFSIGFRFGQGVVDLIEGRYGDISFFLTWK